MPNGRRRSHAHRMKGVHKSERFGNVPIVDQHRRLLGIVSKFDLLHAVKEEKHLASMKAEDVMTRNPITISPETPAMDIMQRIDAKHLIRMPVVNKEGYLVGIVSRRDILLGYLNATRITRIL